MCQYVKKVSPVALGALKNKERGRERGLGERGILQGPDDGPWVEEWKSSLPGVELEVRRERVCRQKSVVVVGVNRRSVDLLPRNPG